MVEKGKRIPGCVDGLLDGLSTVGYLNADELDPLALLLGILGRGEFGVYLAPPDHVEGPVVD